MQDVLLFRLRTLRWLQEFVTLLCNKLDYIIYTLGPLGIPRVDPMGYPTHWVYTHLATRPTGSYPLGDPTRQWVGSDPLIPDPTRPIVTSKVGYGFIYLGD